LGVELGRAGEIGVVLLWGGGWLFVRVREPKLTGGRAEEADLFGEAAGSVEVEYAGCLEATAKP